MIPFVLVLCLSLSFCGNDENEVLRNGKVTFCIPVAKKSDALANGSIVHVLGKIYNSTVKLKGILVEKRDGCLAFDIFTRSLLVVENSQLLEKSDSYHHYVKNEGTCEMINTSLNFEYKEKNELMKSVVQMNAEDSLLLVRKCVWKNIAFCGSGSLLREGSGCFEGIKNCEFVNITKKHSERETKQIEKELMMKMSVMEDCQVESSMNVLEGGIVSGTEGSVFFSCNNCTFLQNERTNRKVKNTERNSTTETQNFMNAEWNGCSAPCGGALYVHDNSNATLTVENSSFVKCKATSTRGGGIFALNIGECSVKHSSFIECSCIITDNYGGGGAEIEVISIQVFFENCFFKDDISGDDGGGLGIWSSKTTKTNECILDCSYINCAVLNNSYSYGGGLLHWSPVDKIVTRNCLFQSCDAIYCGGGVAMRVQTFGGDMLWFCFFHNNTASYGNDINVVDDYLNPQTICCYSTRTEGIRYFAEGDKSEWLPNEGGRSRFVSSKEIQANAKDTFSCGLNESCACLTISHCLSQMIVGFVEEIRVLAGMVVEGKGIDVGGKTISVNGVSSSGSAIATKFEANGLSLFCVGTGGLTVNDLSVIHNTSFESNKQCRLFEVQGCGLIDVKKVNISMDSAHSEKRCIQNSLVKLEEGELKMKDVMWEQTFSSTSLISLSQETMISLTLDNCTFTNIVRTTAGSSMMSVGEGLYSITLEGCTIDGCGSDESKFGGEMMIEMGSWSSLTISGGIVKNCFASITQGKGGGIGLKVRDINAEFLISPAFEGNRAKWGSGIFVDSIDLESTATSGKITSLTASNPLLDEIRGFDKGDDSIPIPLCAYLISIPDEIYVSNVDAFNHFLCGFAEFPCMILKDSLERQEEEKKIVVDGMIEMQDKLIFDSFKHIIRGKDENSGWKVSNDPNRSDGSMITVSTNTNMSSLVFSVPSALPNYEAFFCSTSQLFSLDGCSLTFQDSQSELCYVFLSGTAGEVSVSSLNVLSLTIGNCPLISLDGSNAAGTFTSMNIEDICFETNGVLFGVANGASLISEDSTLSVKAFSQGDLPSGSIRVISSNSAMMLKFTNNTMRGFRGIEGNGGAIECTLVRDCSLEIVGGMMRGCEVNGGNGGGLWVEMKEGSSFTVGNLTEADSAKTTSSNDEYDLFQLVDCKAKRNTYGEHGYGGGIYLHLDDGAQSFILEKMSFTGCDAQEGKEIFINANDLLSAISRSSIEFEVDLNNFTKLNGFERSTSSETFAIPLVLYLWNNFSVQAFVGGSSSHDFSKCGFEEFPCSTITKAVSIYFEGKKKDISIIEPLTIKEELSLSTDEWSIKAKDNEMKCGVVDQAEGAQSGLIESSVSVSVTGVIFSLMKSLTFHESVFECYSGKLTLNECGMEGGSEAITTVFVKAIGGVVEVIEFGSKNMKKWDTSFFIVEGSAETVPSLNMTKSNFAEFTFGDGCVVESCNGNIEEMSGCTFSSITRSKGSGGCISITNKNDNNGRNFKVEINDCTFDGCAVEEEENEIGGGALFCEASSKTNLLINECKLYGCTAPYEGGIAGYGGGVMLNMLNEEEEEAFVISSPAFSSDKPNNAKYGQDLFISSPSLVKSIKNETLQFVKDRLEKLTEDSMRGFDGENRECAIPLIYFWKSVGSSVYIAEEGNNVVVCGLLEYPCRSIDYGMNRIDSSTVEQMTIHGVCDVMSVIEMSGMKLEGTDGKSDKIRFVQSIKENGNAVVECKGVVQFNELGILIPSAFDNGANILIRTGSDVVKTSIVSCTVHKIENVKDEASFVLISALKGIFSIEKTNIVGFSTMHEIMSTSADCVTTMNNVIFKDISLGGKSAIMMSESVISGCGNDYSEEMWNILFEQCTFVNVKNNEASYPSLFCCDISNKMRLKMDNSTIDGCGSTSSNEGGGMFFLLNERGRLEMNHTNVTECFCSNTGRGGGLFLKSQSVSQEALPFVLSNITFRGNVASKGRDVFVKCTDLDSQISESQFLIDFREPFVKDQAIWGCTADNYGAEEDLLKRVFVFRSEFIFVSSIVGNNSNSKQCGEMKGACSSLYVGVSHIIPSSYSQLYIWNETTLTDSCSAQKVTIKSMEANRNAEIKVIEINLAGEGAVTTSEFVRFENISFGFGGIQNVACSCLLHQLNGSLILESVSFQSEWRTTENSQTIFDFSLIIVEEGIFEVDKCNIGHIGFSKPMFQILHSEMATFEDVGVDDVDCKSSMIECDESENLGIIKLKASNITLQDKSLLAFENIHSSLFVSSLVQSSFTNISRSTSGSSIICTTHPMSGFEIRNCSFHECVSKSLKGSQVAIAMSENILMKLCKFEGNANADAELNEITNEICRWNGSVVDFSNCFVMMKDTIVCNSSKGGMSVSEGSTIVIQEGRFENNSPSIENYPSVRRNMLCSDSAEVNIMSLKGGDGVLPDSSMWILNDGCTLKGIVEERASPLFIPVLEDISVNENGRNAMIKFKGTLFVPCDLSFRVVHKTGDVEVIETYPFEEDSFVSETEVGGMIPSENISTIAGETEVSVMILYGKQLAATSSQILKNRTEPKTGIDKVVEGGKEGKFSWILIVCIVAVVVLLIVSIIFIVRWKKVKNEAEDLREIVNDNIRKDPKAFEMVTMEMSPEEQWRRAEREAEKKNDERIKKRVYEKSLGHSESSEHLLSESGSTEYILGRDSDKIPQWMLENVDEEEDDISRKKTPSPSISSTSTTDTSDTESTFVRGEDLCPTTSSMSNLVDAMACSSPHEKLIVDLRDSLFMLLHGKNEKKEMAIGTLQEREVTAAQILFWVANLALHSFDEMNNPLQSLTNLSPHIVLFSEHMVICIALHSECSSSDSGSSSISSSTVVTSTSDDDDDDRDSLPSSAFEDEEDNRKECMRWKAPELLNGTTKHATKKTVVFSVGMMVWECVTLQIPFGEYSGEAAGSMIVRGEKVGMGVAKGSRVRGVVGGCLHYEAEDRMTLGDVKRELIKLFPPGAAVLTMTDAIGYEEESEEACSTSMAIMASGASMTSTTCMTSMTDIGNRSRDMKKPEEVKDEANGK